MEGLGSVVGLALAPVTGGISALRHARMFHPEGAVYRAEVSPSEDTRYHALAERLSGPALARLSTAWWRGGRELPDALGCALRFGDDQDLLLATIRRPWTTPFAPLTTHVHDFLLNDYYGVAPFAVDGVGRARVRLVGPRLSSHGADRAERLANAVESGIAVFLLELLPRWRHGWQPLVEVRLLAPLAVDQEALRFSPFRDGRGLHPRGFVHALRRATYAASQRARPSHR
jgi:hypothetical protein